MLCSISLLTLHQTVNLSIRAYHVTPETTLYAMPDVEVTNQEKDTTGKGYVSTGSNSHHSKQKKKKKKKREVLHVNVVTTYPTSTTDPTSTTSTPDHLRFGVEMLIYGHYCIQVCILFL